MYFAYNQTQMESIKEKIQSEPKVARPAAVTDLFEKSGKKAVWLALGLILVICGFVYKDYLLFDKVFFFKGVGSDTYNLTYPFVYHIADYISQYGIPKWSFNVGMGQSLFPFFLRDPFDIIFYIGGKDHILYGMAYKEVIKVVLSGLVFFYYLKTIKLSSYTSVIGAMLYSFCGFMIVGGCWFAFSFEAFNMALLLLAFEQLFTRGKSYLFPVAIFLICISQPFNLYVYGLFLACYTLLRHVQTGTLTARKIGGTFLKMMGLAILGMLISGPFLLENIVQLLESPRGSGTASYAHTLSSASLFETIDKLQLVTGLARLFSNDMVGTGQTFYGWKNYLEAPMFYCGLPCLLLMPQVFGFLRKKVKIAFLAVLVAWILPFLFPYLRYTFWLFTGDYYRAYSFFVAFLFMYYSLHALDMILQAGKVNVKVLAATIIVLFGLLCYPYLINIDTLVSPDNAPLNFPVFIFVSALLIVYGALLNFMTRPKLAVYVKYAFCLVLMTELIYLSRTTMNNMEASETSEFLPKTGYDDYTMDALEYIKKTDNSSFYRVDKSYFSSPAKWYSHNDGMVQGFKGTRAYSPYNQLHYVLYLQLMGIIKEDAEQESRWTMGQATRPALGAENQVKYYLAKTNVNPAWRVTCDQLPPFGNVTAFRNNFVLPLGYTYDRYINEDVFRNLSIIQKDFVSLRTCVLDDYEIKQAVGLKQFQLTDTLPAGAYNMDLFRKLTQEAGREALKISRFDQNRLEGTINVSEDKMMYLSIPYDDGWKLKVDGQKQDKAIVSAGMTGVMLRKGQHTIEMAYDLRYFGIGVLLSVLGLLAYVGFWFYMKKHEKRIIAPENAN